MTGPEQNDPDAPRPGGPDGPHPDGVGPGGVGPDGDAADLEASEQLDEWIRVGRTGTLDDRAADMRRVRSLLRSDLPSADEVGPLVTAALEAPPLHSADQHSTNQSPADQNPADIRSPSAGSVRNPGQVGKPRLWIPAAAAILLVVLGITAAVVASGTRDETAVDASSDRANAGAANADSDDFAVESQLEDPAAPQTTVSPSPDRGAGDPAEESADADEPPGDAIPESGSEAVPGAEGAVPGAEGAVPGADGGQPDSRDTANAALSAFAGVRAVIVLQLP